MFVRQNHIQIPYGSVHVSFRQQRLEPTATIFSEAMDANNLGWNGWTVKPRINAAAMTVPDFALSQIRVTIEAASTEGLQFTKFYVGHAAGSGDAWDAAAFSQILWGGNAGSLCPVGSTLTSDWINFAWNKTSALIFSIYISGDSANDGLRQRGSAGGNLNYYYKSGDHAATANDSGYTTVANTQGIIRAVEVR